MVKWKERYLHLCDSGKSARKDIDSARARRFDASWCEVVVKLSSWRRVLENKQNGMEDHYRAKRTLNWAEGGRARSIENFESLHYMCTLRNTVSTLNCPLVQLL